MLRLASMGVMVSLSLVAVEGKTHLKAESVAATESAGLHACFHQLVPYVLDVGVWP